MQIQDQPHIGVLGADPAAITQFLRRVQALGGEHAVLLPLSPGGRAGLRTVSVRSVHTAAPAEAARSGGGAGRLRLHGHRRAGQRGHFCEQLTAAAGVPVLSTAGAVLPQLVGALRAARERAVYARRARRQCLWSRRAALRAALQLSRCAVQALLGCVQPEKVCSEQVLRSIIELELARGSDSVVLDSAQLCAAFAHFGLAARYPQAADGMELLAQAALLHTAAASGVRRA